MKLRNTEGKEVREFEQLRVCRGCKEMKSLRAFHGGSHRTPWGFCVDCQALMRPDRQKRDPVRRGEKGRQLSYRDAFQQYLIAAEEAPRNMKEDANGL